MIQPVSRCQPEPVPLRGEPAARYALRGDMAQSAAARYDPRGDMAQSAAARYAPHGDMTQPAAARYAPRGDMAQSAAVLQPASQPRRMAASQRYETHLLKIIYKFLGSVCDFLIFLLYFVLFIVIEKMELYNIVRDVCSRIVYVKLVIVLVFV